MVRSIGWASGVVVAGLAVAGQAQAQAAHKCIVNGAAVYQVAACPAANDQKSLVIPPAPSQQELLDATANGRLQSVQPGANVPVAATPRRYDRRGALAPQPQPQPDAAPSTNCDQINQDYHDAQYRRDELSAPGTGASRSAGLQRAIDDLKRLQGEANQAHCRLR
jgi:hypothetical protein